LLNPYDILKLRHETVSIISCLLYFNCNACFIYCINFLCTKAAGLSSDTISNSDKHLFLDFGFGRFQDPPLRSHIPKSKPRRNPPSLNCPYDSFYKYFQHFCLLGNNRPPAKFGIRIRYLFQTNKLAKT